MNEEQELTNCRNQIDEIDQQILALLNKRADLALLACAIKVKYQGEDAKIHRPERESKLVESLLKKNLGPLEVKSVEKIFTLIITECRELENKNVSY